MRSSVARVNGPRRRHSRQAPGTVRRAQDPFRGRRARLIVPGPGRSLPDAASSPHDLVTSAAAGPGASPGDPTPRPPFAAVLAGGESRRFGSPKALARVGGARVVDRVVRAARGALGETVL